MTTFTLLATAAIAGAAAAQHSRGLAPQTERELLERAKATLEADTVGGDGVQYAPFRGVEPSSAGRFKGVWNWDAAFHALAVVRWDPELARDQFRIMMKFQGEDGMLPDCVRRNPAEGVFRGCTKPPVWGWAVWEIDRVAHDESFLREAYAALKRHDAFLREKRYDAKAGLFRYDGNSDDPATRKKYCGWDSGWDDSPRWDGDPSRVLAVDLNCWMVLYWRSMRDIAQRLGLADECDMWAGLARDLARRVEARFWDEADACYYDWDTSKNDFSRVLTPASFMPLFVGVASVSHAAAMSRHAARMEPGWPTVSYDHPAYRPDVYWRGRTWLNVAYVALKGLKFYGYDRIADSGRETILGWVDGNKESIRENYNSRTGAPLGEPGFGWSAVFVMKFIRDWNRRMDDEIPAGDAPGVTDAEAFEIARERLAGLTLEEKVELTAGSGTMSIKVPGTGREWLMSDSSHTVRADMDRWTWGYCGSGDEATVMPSLSALAATWSREAAAAYGHVLGEEARARGKDQLLGPGVNIMRIARCGRNWEYLGEDPCLAAELVVPYIRAMQSHGVAATVKHFCLNSQELARHEVNSICGERALNEIYLPAFEAAILRGGVFSVMTSYNKVNGDWSSENAYLQRGILRDRWHFRGMVVSDWGGTCSTAKSAMSGGNVEMNRGDAIRHFMAPKAGTKPLADAVRRGEVLESTVDEMALHTLWTMAKTGFFSPLMRESDRRNTPAHQATALSIGKEAIALLKNGEKTLPLDASKMKKVVVAGRLADTKLANKGYSAEGKPPYEITPLGGLKERLGAAEIEYLPLPGETGTNAADRVAALDAIRAAADGADAVLVFTGTSLGTGPAMEGESADRTDLSLPDGHDGAIEAMLSWNLKNLVIVVHSGSPLELPWADGASTILHHPYLGQESGRALAAVVFGDVNPSGKLPCTWPKSMKDTPAEAVGTYTGTNSVYNEDVFVGYRWYDEKSIRPLFPFGHGLSYTTFEYGKIEVKNLEDGTFEAEIPVSNTGVVAGSEVVQLYVAPVDSRVSRPVKELKGFCRLSLEPGETKTARMRLARRDFAHWDVLSHDWIADAGEYRLLAGASSADIRGEANVRLKGEAQ